MALCKTFLLLVAAVFLSAATRAVPSTPLLARGWQQLAIDNDLEALRLFSRSCDEARATKDTLIEAEALLYMGIASYGTSLTRGLDYATKAMARYRQAERAHPARAQEGRSRCLQLISSIYMRQGHYEEALQLSRSALAGFPAQADSTGTLGLIFNSIAGACKHLGKSDSVSYYLHRALEAQLAAHNFMYLPGAYLSIAELELAAGRYARARAYYDTARRLADNTGNRQAQVLALLGDGFWHWKAGGAIQEAEAACQQALEIANSISDKTFRLKVMGALRDLKSAQQDYKSALALQTAMNATLDSVASADKQAAISMLELQFNMAEKDRELLQLHQERKIARLTNLLLWGAVVLIFGTLGGGVIFLKKVARKDRLLLRRKDELLAMEEALRTAREKEHRQAADQMTADIEHKEGQLSALTMQMLQKNELMQELKEQLAKDRGTAHDPSITKIINKGLNQDKEWSDFNSYFESINKNFYGRLKQVYGDISPNDLKICALIKMNLSTKEMAGILNISPDSVKTARYRLRKKLALHTEDNLTNFIMQI